MGAETMQTLVLIILLLSTTVLYAEECVTAEEIASKVKVLISEPIEHRLGLADEPRGIQRVEITAPLLVYPGMQIMDIQLVSDHPDNPFVIPLEHTPVFNADNSFNHPIKAEFSGHVHAMHSWYVVLDYEAGDFSTCSARAIVKINGA